MQMNALRSANFAKLSSNSATSDEYWLTSMSAGTPAGYCLSQIRSMGLSPRFLVFVVLLPVASPRTALFPAVWQCGRIWQAAARYRRIGVPGANEVNGGKAAEIADRAFSSEVDTGSREENASNQESRASALIQSEPKFQRPLIPCSPSLEARSAAGHGPLPAPCQAGKRDNTSSHNLSGDSPCKPYCFI